MAAMRRLEDGVQMPVLTGRNSKRRFRVDSGAEADRHRSCVTVSGESGSGAVKDSLYP